MWTIYTSYIPTWWWMLGLLWFLWLAFFGVAKVSQIEFDLSFVDHWIWMNPRWNKHKSQLPHPRPITMLRVVVTGTVAFFISLKKWPQIPGAKFKHLRFNSCSGKNYMPCRKKKTRKICVCLPRNKNPPELGVITRVAGKGGIDKTRYPPEV